MPNGLSLPRDDGIVPLSCISSNKKKKESQRAALSGAEHNPQSRCNRERERERENLIAAQIKYEEVFDGRKETPI